MNCFKNRPAFAIIIMIVIAIMGFSGCSSAGSKTEKKTEETVTQKEAVAAGTDISARESIQTAEEAGTAAAPGIIEKEYQPNPDYDRYAKVDYLIEDIGAEFTATVSKKADDSEYEVHCMVDNVEQLVVLDKDLAVVSDKTGELGYDAPLIVQKAIDADKWADITK